MIALELFQELYELVFSEICDDLKYIRIGGGISSEEPELIAWNLVAQPLMGVFTPYLFKTYFKPGIRLLTREEIDSILAAVSKWINKTNVRLEDAIMVIEKIIEKFLVSQGWTRDIAWKRASYLAREFVERLLALKQ